MSQKNYVFFDNLISIGLGKFSLFLREYWELAANLLSTIPKILDLIKNKFFEFNLAQNHEKLEAKYFPTDFRSFWDSLTRSLPMGFHEQSLLCI